MTEFNEDFATRARREKRSIPFELFKGMGGKNGVISLDLREAYTNEIDESKTAGVVFLNMAPTVGKNQYGWDKKISIALGLPDIGKLLLYLQNPRHQMFTERGTLSIVHDRGMNQGKKLGQDVKYLMVSKPEDRTNYFFNIEEKNNGQSVAKFSVPVGPDEALVMIELLKVSIPAILSWHAPTKPVTK